MRLFLFIFLLSSLVWANEEASKKTNIAFIDNSLAFLDDTQNFAQDSWKGLNYSVDSYFSDKRYLAEDNKSKIMVSWVGNKTESKPFQSTWDLALKIHLPQVTKRLSLTFEKERDDILDATNSYANRSTNQNKAERQEKATPLNNYAAAATFLLTENPYFKSDLRTGIKLLLPLDPFLKYTIYHDVKFKKFNIGAEQKLILFRQDGFSEFTSLRWGYRLSPELHLSQNNVVAWRDSTDHFTARNNLSLGHALSEDRGLTYTLGANALFSPTFYYTSYDASVSYRQKLFSDWFFGTMTLGSEFLKEHQFKQDNFIQFALDIQ